jgi:hypothetical protein
MIRLGKELFRQEEPVKNFNLSLYGKSAAQQSKKMVGWGSDWPDSSVTLPGMHGYDVTLQPHGHQVPIK